MLENYLPIAIFITFGLCFGCIPILFGLFLGSKRTNSKSKVEAFECGFPPFSDARFRFDVRFYLVAILFILFDLEIAFFFPWAVVFDQLGYQPFIAMMIFLLVLSVGFIYEWKKGALNWE
jgi:NADH-quinone oxidoreductase subunit A